MKRAPAFDRTATAIAAATPAARDRYLDLLRALAIAAVVIGHWLIAVVWIDDGGLQASAALDMEPATHWLTWIVQVMPIFFLVGGAVNARSWRSTRASGGAWAGWMAARATRLLRPTTVLVWFWMVLGAVTLAGGVDRGLITLAARNAVVPLWFLAVYLLLIALVPALLGAHERFGLALPAGLLVVAAGIDALVGAGVPHVGLLNYIAVWAVPTVLGFNWLDGRLERRAVRGGLAVMAALALFAAITWFGYPISMVGLAGGQGPNTPAVTLGLLGCVQTGIVVALRAPVDRWLRRPRAWAAVVRLNMVAMTVYLWHLTVMVLVIGLLAGTGTWWSAAPLSAAWWLTRPLWIIGLAAVLTPVILLLAAVERTTPRPAGTRSLAGMAVVPAVTAIAVAELTLGGVLGGRAIAAAVGVTAAAVYSGAFRVPGRALRSVAGQEAVPASTSEASAGEGVLRGAFFRDGAGRDDVLCALLQDDGAEDG